MLRRREFVKLLASSIAGIVSPEVCFADKTRTLWLRHDRDEAMLDIDSSSDYRIASWLLRDARANRTASPSMKLLQTAAWMQTFFAIYQVHRPFIVHSGFRTRFTNEKVGGAKASLHMQDRDGEFHAMDISMHGISVEYLGRLAAYARQGGVGFYSDRPNGFIHIDDGRIRYWRR